MKSKFLKEKFEKGFYASSRMIKMRVLFLNPPLWVNMENSPVSRGALL